MPASADSTSAPLDQQRKSKPARWEVLVLALLVIAAFAIRIYRLGNFPDTVLADEADNAQDSVRALYGQPPENGFFGIDWTSQPALSLYKEAAFIAAFGFTIPAMRLSSAILSSLALIPFFLLLRRQFGRIASFGATALLATEVWYLNFSRSGWNIVDTCLYMLLAMLFLVRGLQAVAGGSGEGRRGWAYFAAAGFCGALGLYAYPAGRISTVGMVMALPIVLLLFRKHARNLLLGYLVLFAAEAITIAPQALYAVRRWEHFNGRANVVLLLNDPAYKQDPLGTLVQQLGRNLRGPWDGEVNNTPQYSPAGRPQFSRVTGILALVGMVLSVLLASLRRHFETWLWWLMLLAGWGITQLFTVNTPNGARGLVYVPVFIYFAAVTLDASIRGTGRLRLGPDAGLALQKAVAGMAVFAVVIASGFNVKQYVDWQNDPKTRQARYLYVTAREFPAWAQTITDLAKAHQGTMNVGQWRDAHPIQDIANP